MPAKGSLKGKGSRKNFYSGRAGGFGTASKARKLSDSVKKSGASRKGTSRKSY